MATRITCDCGAYQDLDTLPDNGRVRCSRCGEWIVAEECLKPPDDAVPLELLPGGTGATTSTASASRATEQVACLPHPDGPAAVRTSERESFARTCGGVGRGLLVMGTVVLIFICLSICYQEGRISGAGAILAAVIIGAYMLPGLVLWLCSQAIPDGGNKPVIVAMVSAVIGGLSLLLGMVVKVVAMIQDQSVSDDIPVVLANFVFAGLLGLVLYRAIRVLAGRTDEDATSILDRPL